MQKFWNSRVNFGAGSLHVLPSNRGYRIHLRQPRTNVSFHPVHILPRVLGGQQGEDTYRTEDPFSSTEGARCSVCVQASCVGRRRSHYSFYVAIIVACGWRFNNPIITHSPGPASKTLITASCDQSDFFNEARTEPPWPRKPPIILITVITMHELCICRVDGTARKRPADASVCWTSARRRSSRVESVVVALNRGATIGRD